MDTPMDVDRFLEDIRSAPDYADQIVYVRQVASRGATFADPDEPLTPPLRDMLEKPRHRHLPL